MKSLLMILTALMLTACGQHESECTETDWRSYYNPNRGTLNLHYNVNSCDPEIVGEPLDGLIAVGSDVANSLRIVGHGTNVIHKFESTVNGLHTDGDILRFSHKFNTIEMDGSWNQSANATGAARCATKDFVCAEDGVLLSSGVLLPAQYPRDAAQAHGLTYVADTFGHQVVAYDDNGTRIESFDVYYPNSVQIVGRKMIVAAEHANQILEIDLDTKRRKIIFGCDLDIYSDADATALSVIRREQSGALTREDGRSICEGRLYSPNMATLHTDGTLLIADTDNHRVLIVRDGVIKTEIRNLNNPTRATFWRSGKRVAK